MKQNKLKSRIRKFTPQKKRAVAEVISSLLLVVITVVGALILVNFLDESFVAGSLSVASSTDTSLKTIKLRAFDTRDGAALMDPTYNLDNTLSGSTDQFLLRDGGLSLLSPIANASPASGGTEYVVIQIENRGINPIWLSDVYLDNVGHVWDFTTSNAQIDGFVNPGAGDVPRDGMFSILPADGGTVQNQDTQIKSGQTVNLVVKLDSDNPDIPLSKTIRVQLNIGTNTLQEFLIESGGAQ